MGGRVTLNRGTRVARSRGRASRKSSTLFAPGQSSERIKAEGRVIGRINVRDPETKEVRTRARALEIARTYPWWEAGAMVAANDERCHVIVVPDKRGRTG